MIISHQSSWNIFWNRPQTTTPLAFFRVSIALLTLIHTAVLYNESEFLDVYGQYGLIRGELNEVLLAPDFPQLSWLTNWLGTQGVDEVTALKVILWIYSGILLSLALGFCTRASGFLAWGINLMMINSSILFAYGYDTFTNNALLYCWLLPVGSSYSIDAGWSERKDVMYKEATVAYRILQLHLCIVYIFSGLHKASGDQWWNGEAIWRAVMQPPFNTYSAAWLADWPVVSLLLGWGTLVLETAYPLWIYPSKWRYYGLFAIICMHVGIGLFMGLWFFALIMILWNIAAFGIPNVSTKTALSTAPTTMNQAEIQRYVSLDFPNDVYKKY